MTLYDQCTVSYYLLVAKYVTRAFCKINHSSLNSVNSRELQVIIILLTDE